jgi:hypothetical protein
MCCGLRSEVKAEHCLKVGLRTPRGGIPNPMSSFRSLALVLALGLPAAHITLAQSSSSSSTPAPQTEAAPKDQIETSVQARIRARREARRAQAIRDIYSHLYEPYTLMGYMRFVPGPGLQRTTLYAWDSGFTRFYNERLGATIDVRGNYGTTFVGVNPYSVTKPSISVYSVQGGPTYRFYLQPKYSLGVRGTAGYAHGNFSGDTNGFGGQLLGLHPDGGTFAANAAFVAEYNISPGLGLRLAPEYNFSGFGSTFQDSRGFTAGFVFRLGKQ